MNIAALIYYYNVYDLLIVIELALTWLCCISHNIAFYNIRMYLVQIMSFLYDQYDRK